ncbi:hypothetical protein JYK02_22970 [Corallococcus macrosporus]|uniref:Uncharacterized protein n=1 Tax=Corallococcus macrosporus TaxID=35 RepID=A0ABS3DGB3_9BACT|nr:hypothetical protein [Corallococcus macrosporus]MBN8230377.1 hypothetical protein [Corallococcus macrosporus]
MPRRPQQSLPEKPLPAPAELEAKTLVTSPFSRDEFENDLPDKPPPGPAGFDR